MDYGNIKNSFSEIKSSVSPTIHLLSKTSLEHAKEAGKILKNILNAPKSMVMKLTERTSIEGNSEKSNRLSNLIHAFKESIDTKMPQEKIMKLSKAIILKKMANINVNINKSPDKIASSESASRTKKPERILVLNKSETKIQDSINNTSANVAKGSGFVDKEELKIKTKQLLKSVEKNFRNGEIGEEYAEKAVQDINNLGKNFIEHKIKFLDNSKKHLNTDISVLNKHILFCKLCDSSNKDKSTTKMQPRIEDLESKKSALKDISENLNIKNVSSAEVTLKISRNKSKQYDQFLQILDDLKIELIKSGADKDIVKSAIKAVDDAINPDKIISESEAGKAMSELAKLALLYDVPIMN